MGFVKNSEKRHTDEKTHFSTGKETYAHSKTAKMPQTVDNMVDNVDKRPRFFAALFLHTRKKTACVPRGKNNESAFFLKAFLQNGLQTGCKTEKGKRVCIERRIQKARLRRRKYHAPYQEKQGIA